MRNMRWHICGKKWYQDTHKLYPALKFTLTLALVDYTVVFSESVFGIQNQQLNFPCKTSLAGAFFGQLDCST